MSGQLFVRTTRQRAILVTLFLGLFTAPLVLAQGAKVSSPVELARIASDLKPGEWVWAGDVAPSGPVLIYVDLSAQRATVYRNGVRIAVTTVSTGRPSHPTPTGVFTILQKQVKHRSTIYNGAPMPYMQRLTWGGVALHAGGLPGYPESHGCIHLPISFSQELYKITTTGATVVVEGDPVKHIDTTDASLLAPMDVDGTDVSRTHLDNEEFRWRPELSPTGPLTIIISKKDQRIVVLRNGVEIGRSVAAINDDDPGSHVINLTIAEDGTRHWIYTGLPGHDEDQGRVLDEATMNRVRMPRRFYEDVQSQLTTGTTVLVTQSSVGTRDTGKPLMILDSVTPKP